MTKFTLKKRIKQLKAQNKSLNDARDKAKDKSMSYKARNEDQANQLSHLRHLAHKRANNEADLSDQIDSLCSKNEKLKSLKKASKTSFRKLKMEGLKMYDNMYLIYAGAGMDNDEDDDDCIHSCRFHDPEAQGDVEPEWYINDPNDDIHCGFINYDHDLKRKIFTKAEAKEFYQRYLNFIRAHSNARPVSIRGNAILSMLKANTMTFKEAKDRGLILTSDYTPSYNNYLDQRKSFERHQEEMEIHDDDDMPMGPCDI